MGRRDQEGSAVGKSETPGSVAGSSEVGASPTVSKPGYSEPDFVYRISNKL